MQLALNRNETNYTHFIIKSIKYVSDLLIKYEKGFSIYLKMFPDQ